MPQVSWQPYGGQQTLKSPQSAAVVLHCPSTHREVLQPTGSAARWMMPPWQSLSLMHAEQPNFVQY